MVPSRLCSIEDRNVFSLPKTESLSVLGEVVAVRAFSTDFLWPFCACVSREETISFSKESPRVRSALVGAPGFVTRGVISC